MKTALALIIFLGLVGPVHSVRPLSVLVRAQAVADSEKNVLLINEQQAIFNKFVAEEAFLPRFAGPRSTPVRWIEDTDFDSEYEYKIENFTLIQKNYAAELAKTEVDPTPPPPQKVSSCEHVFLVASKLDDGMVSLGNFAHYFYDAIINVFGDDPGSYNSGEDSSSESGLASDVMFSSRGFFDRIESIAIKFFIFLQTWCALLEEDFAREITDHLPAEEAEDLADADAQSRGFEFRVSEKGLPWVNEIERSLSPLTSSGSESDLCSPTPTNGFIFTRSQLRQMPRSLRESSGSDDSSPQSPAFRRISKLLQKKNKRLEDKLEKTRLNLVQISMENIALRKQLKNDIIHPRGIYFLRNQTRTPVFGRSQ